MMNKNSLDTLCASLCYALGVEPPEHAAAPNKDLTDYIDKVFEGQKADRVVMYNPDAVGQWLFEKYPQLFTEVVEATELQLPLRSPMPPVTPVCFGTMYTGAQPQVHGITEYRKPVLTIDTIFDALVRAGKKVALVAGPKGSVGKIFLEREIDYFLCKNIAEMNATAARLIMEDQHDFYVIYNGNYDYRMHRSAGPESMEALAELRVNVLTYQTFDIMISQHWGHHRTLMGFAMDHGCHLNEQGEGDHGLDIPEDRNITHFYKGKVGQA